VGHRLYWGGGQRGAFGFCDPCFGLIGGHGCVWTARFGQSKEALTMAKRDPEFRKAVLEADFHECVICGSTEMLEADHMRNMR